MHTRWGWPTDAAHHSDTTYAANVSPVIEQIRAGGASLRQIAAELNARGIKFARGGKWHATTVRNVIGFLAAR